MTFLRIVIPLYLFDLSMISAQTRSAFVARENRYPLFRIMLKPHKHDLIFGTAGLKREARLRAFIRTMTNAQQGHASIG
jgi:hypothetical protein